jgi:2-oxoglutarate ferredoxin oxidoreductase subunit gamma
MIILSAEALTRYGALAKHAKLLLLDTLIPTEYTQKLAAAVPGFPARCRVLRLPATQLAQQLGSAFAANMIMLGAFCALSGGLVTKAALERSIRDVVRAEHIEVNLRALQRGYEEGERLQSKK